MKKLIKYINEFIKTIIIFFLAIIVLLLAYNYIYIPIIPSIITYIFSFFPYKEEDIEGVAKIRVPFIILFSFIAILLYGYNVIFGSQKLLGKIFDVITIIAFIGAANLHIFSLLSLRLENKKVKEENI